MNILVEILSQRNLTITCCESVTGGLFAASIIDIQNASKIFKGSYILYSDEMKKEHFIDQKDREYLENNGPYNPQTARAMAESTKKKFSADLSISFTGMANSESESFCYVCIIYKDNVFDYFQKFVGTRNYVRRQIVDFGVEQLKFILGI